MRKDDAFLAHGRSGAGLSLVASACDQANISEQDPPVAAALATQPATTTEPSDPALPDSATGAGLTIAVAPGFDFFAGGAETTVWVIDVGGATPDFASIRIVLEGG